MYSLQNDVSLDINLIKSFVFHGGIRRMTIGELFDEYLGILKRRVGVNLTYRTYRKFELTRDKFLGMVPPTDPVSSIIVCKITLRLRISHFRVIFLFLS